MDVKPSGLALTLLLAWTPGTVLRAGNEKDSPRGVAYEIIHTAIDHFGFSLETLKFEKKWLVPDLYARLLKKANQPVPKGDAPDIEGDIFLDCQEPPKSFTVPLNGDVILEAGMKVHSVLVTLTWPDHRRNYRVLLQQINGAWKVYDVDFGKDGLLTDLLK